MESGVIAAASELFEARHFSGVVAMCTDALDDEPECLPLRLIRARAQIALRRDLEAQADLRDIVRLDPRCSAAYRLLGELAARRDENAAAAGLFREALRLDPGDREAGDWLLIVAESDERPTRPFARVEDPDRPAPPTARTAPPTAPVSPSTLAGDPPRPRPARPTPRLSPRHTTRPAARSPVPDPPGFEHYLVSHGVLTRERLRAAQAYQRAMKVQLSTAIITLGLATPQRIEWAAVAHRAELYGRFGADDRSG
jgi:hypothetical protein